MKAILLKLHGIMSEVDYIQKDKSNSFHGYKYASEEAIKEKIHPLLVKHGVLFQVTAINPINTPVKTVSGKDELLTQLSVSYTFWDIESGECLNGNFVGSGQDNGDKGVYKALTGAIKYILTSTFLIPTGLDPEDDTKIESIPKKTVIIPPQGVPLATPLQVMKPLDDVAQAFFEEPFVGMPDYLKPAAALNGCPKCGKPMKARQGKNGKSFFGCSGFPTCRHTEQIG